MFAATSGWNEATLLSTYHQGLDPHIHAQIAIYDDTMGLKSFMQQATCISQWLSACQPEETNPHSVSPATCHLVPEPMQYASWHCTSHTHGACSPPCSWILPVLCRCRSSHQGLPHSTPRPWNLYPVTATSKTLHSVSVSSLVDSGSSEIFISQALLSHLNMPCRHQTREPWVETTQGRPLGRERVKYRAPPVIFQLGCLHRETITFLVLEGPTVDIILGHP